MKSMVKQPYYTHLQVGHPLARGLRGAWLLNEGRGNMLWDLSRTGHAGMLTDMDPASDWVSGPQGYALDFDGTNDRVIVGPDAGINLGTANACVIRLKVRYLASHILLGHKAWDDGGYFLGISGTSLNYCADASYVGVPHGMAVGDEVWLGVSRQGTSVTFYKNGVQLGTPQTLSANSTLAISSIGGYRVSPYYAANMRCDYVYCWDRPLSAAEMAWLYRDPFCFVRAPMVLPELGFVGATIHHVSGSADAGSAAIADADVIPLADRPTGRPWQEVVLDIEASWLREALLNGMTDTAAKLGTVLTQGWFWTRRAGCSAVYRCEDSTFDIRTSELVAVAAADASQVPLPTYLPHEAGSTCYYVVRRFNGCGQQDRTTRGAVVVRIGLDGQPTAPVPNAIVNLTAVQKQGCVCLQWFYWPLDQGAIPRGFDVYWDGGTGEINFANAIAVVAYEGRAWCGYQSQSLADGKYLFAVRAKGVAGVEGPPWKLEIQIPTSEIAEGSDILDVEAV
jgi:hypothetical protein